MKASLAVGKIAVLQLVYGVFYSMYFFFLPLFLEQSGYSRSEIGLLVGLFAVVALFSSIPLGMLSDKVKPRRLAFFAALLVGLFYLAVGRAEGLVFLAPAFLIGGIGDNLFRVSLDSTVYKLIKKDKKKGVKVGLNKFGAAAGSAIGAIGGGVMLTLFSFTDVLTGIAVSMLGVAFLTRLMADVGTFKISALDYARELKRPGAALLGSAFFLLAYHFGSEQTTMTLYAKDVIGLSTEAIGLLFALNVCFYAVVSFAAGKSFDMTKRYKEIFFAGLMLSALGNFFYAFSWDFYTALFSRLIHDTGDAFAIIFAGFSVARIFPKSKLGGSTGGFLMVSVLGTTAGALGSGVIADYFSLSASFIVAGAVTLAGAGMVLLASDKAAGSLFK